MKGFLHHPSIDHLLRLALAELVYELLLAHPRAATGEVLRPLQRGRDVQVQVRQLWVRYVGAQELRLGLLLVFWTCLVDLRRRFCWRSWDLPPQQARPSPSSTVPSTAILPVSLIHPSCTTVARATSSQSSRCHPPQPCFHDCSSLSSS